MGRAATCAPCGTTFQTATRGRPQRYCSEACRRAAWNATRRDGSARPRGDGSTAPRLRTGTRRTSPADEVGMVRSRKGKRRGRRPVATLPDGRTHLYFD